MPTPRQNKNQMDVPPSLSLGSLGVMRPLTPYFILATLCIIAGCSKQQDRSISIETDWPQSARAAVYSQTANPGFDSPESASRLLEQRWSLADIRAFCIPARRHNLAYQNLVIDSPEAWKGRLYSNQRTGFDRISWYATVREGKLLQYSLEVYRGDDFWLLEIGNPETVKKPPQVTPDPAADYFVGPKGDQHATGANRRSR